MPFQLTQTREIRRDIQILQPRTDGTSGNVKVTLKVKLRMLTQDELDSCQNDLEVVDKALVCGYDILDLDGNEVPQDMTKQLLLEETTAVTAIAREVYDFRLKNFRRDGKGI